VIPIYVVMEAAILLPAFQDVRNPTVTGHWLYIHMAVSEVSLPPLLAYQSRKIVGCYVWWPVNNHVIVQAAFQILFDDSEGLESFAMSLGCRSERLGIQPVEKMATFC